MIYHKLFEINTLTTVGMENILVERSSNIFSQNIFALSTMLQPTLVSRSLCPFLSSIEFLSNATTDAYSAYLALAQILRFPILSAGLLLFFLKINLVCA